MLWILESQDEKCRDQGIKHQSSEQRQDQNGEEMSGMKDGGTRRMLTMERMVEEALIKWLSLCVA